jgi:anti-sigma-K factor RskA
MTAAELALGVLEGDERASALRRVLAEPAFAREVERWRDYLGQLFAVWPEVEAPAGLLPRIEHALDGGAAMPAPGWWRAAAIASTLAAACLLLVVLIRPGFEPRPVIVPSPVPSAVPTPVIPASLLVAELAPTGKAEGASALYDPASGSLRIGDNGWHEAGHDAELWVIPAGGTPRSLGLLDPGGRTEMTVSPANRDALAAGATLAVTIEPLGGSPTGQPTTTPIVAGALSRV